LEGADHGIIVITLLRDLSIYSGSLAIAYATSDLSARGIDEYHYDECMELATKDRGPRGCGDYQLTSGVMYIREGMTSGGFTVKIMNDLCYENYQEYIQVFLKISSSL
jgi:hypothetical protein